MSNAGKKPTMSAYAGSQHARLVYSLQKLPDDRNLQDLLAISNYLRECACFESLPASTSSRDDSQLLLYKLGKAARYESHASNTVLYRQDEPSSCWYVLLSGLVFIEGCVYSPGSSFGVPMPGATRRQADCIVLEPSEMLVLPSETDPAAVLRPGEPGAAAAQLPPAAGAATLQPFLPPAGAAADPSPVLGASAELDMYKPIMHQQLLGLAHQAFVAFSDSSSSVHSAGSVSADDVDLDLALNDIDSDDEDSYAESTVSSRDHVREALEKQPGDRTNEDIETLLEFMHNLPTFANMTTATRRALCAVMVYAIVEKAGTMVINDGEELDSWSAILNGRVEISMPDGSTKTLQMGDSFGIGPSKERFLHAGVMRTVVDNCQFVCIAQQDYYGILNEGKANTHVVVENDKAVLVTEMRVLDEGARKGAIVIRGTPERLINHLVEDPSPVDATYVEDFLLTYRTFLPSSLVVANQLLTWFRESKQLRARVTRIMLLWVNNHFNDFESSPELIDALHSFEQLLQEESMLGQRRMLHLACQAKARVRTATITRAARDEPLPFSLNEFDDGRQMLGNRLFVSRVDRRARGANELGLRRGDQVLEVNGLSLLDADSGTATSQPTMMRAMEMFHTATHLCITVRSNLLDFHDMASKSVGPQKGAFAVINAGTTLYKLTAKPPPPDSSGATESGDCEAPVGGGSVHQPILSAGKKHKESRSKDKTATMGHSSKDKLMKALKHMKLIPKGAPAAAVATNRAFSSYPLSSQDATDGCTLSRPRSNSDPDIKGSLQRSNSSPDVAAATVLGAELGRGLSTVFPDHILKIYKADQTCKYVPVTKETTVRDVVVFALKLFGISDHSSNLQNITCNNYALCEVSVEAGGLVKQRRLPDTVSNLADKLGVHSRYYLKNNMIQEPLVTDEAVAEMAKEGRFTFLTLSCQEIAMQLSIADYTVFQQVDATEYVDDLCGIKSKHGCAQLHKFSELINKEMFWVATEVCKECNIVRRAKTLKHFIKIARYCKGFRNYNTTFAILSGLGHGTVSRLRSTWERLPGKYQKMFNDLESIMDPTRNMAKYRGLLNSKLQPPVIPFFPIVKKDLTFIDLGNDTKVDGLINFEKMRMISKEVRQICRLASAQYSVNDMLYGSMSSTGSNGGGIFHGFADASSEVTAVSGFVTTRRKKRGSQVLQPKRMFEEAQMARWVKAYLAELVVEKDEDRLLEMSFKCEPNRRMDMSSQGSTLSVGSNSSLGSSASVAAPSGPKFGSQSPEAVRKLMALSEGAKPVNVKKRHAQPTAAGASSGSSGGMPSLPSPLLGGGRSSTTLSFGGMTTASLQSSLQSLPRSVDLSSESSSVASMARGRKMSSVSSSSSSGFVDTPQEIRKSYPHGPRLPDRDSDSGHGSLTSSVFSDAQSTCSINSIGSPVMHPRQAVAATTHLAAVFEGAAVVTAAHRRPQLPSYEALMRESVAVAPHYHHGSKVKPQARGGDPSSLSTKHLLAASMVRQTSAAALVATCAVHTHGSERPSVSSGQMSSLFGLLDDLEDEEGVVSMV